MFSAAKAVVARGCVLDCRSRSPCSNNHSSTARARMAASRRDSTPPPPPTRPLPVHLSQIAHIVRLICDARLPLHLGRKNFSHPDDGGLRLSSVRLFPEVESDVTAYMLHFRYAAAALKSCDAHHISSNNVVTPTRFRSPLYICIGKAASKLSPTIQPFVTHTGQKDPPPVRWPSTESDDQPCVHLWRWWCWCPSCLCC